MQSKGNLFMFFSSSSTCLLFGFDNNLIESYSIGSVLPLQLPPIAHAHDEGFLLKIRIISCLLVEVLNDTIWTED